MKNQRIAGNIDWICIIIYCIMVILGWLNIYSSSLSSMDGISEKQLLFIILSIPLIFVILFLEGKFFEKYATLFFGFAILSLLGLFVVGKNINGQQCWYAFGNFTLQPSEFAKVATALALAKYLSDNQINLRDASRQLQAFAIIFLPVLLILPQPDPGSSLIFCAFIFALYREGLPSKYIWAGITMILLFVLSLIMRPKYIILLTLVIIVFVHFKSKMADRNIILSTIFFSIVCGFILSVDYVFNHIFKQHHRDRFNLLLGRAVDADMKGIGYNTNQSQIAIGSGGWLGKGFLEGTQTKGGFVPEQHTDFIFSTVGEELGFVGSITIILLFLGLLLRILYLAERQKTKFSRVYGYSVAGILFIHFFVNIAMVVGIFPTIGVPLPFFSYGGSSLWGFTILLFIFLKLDANKVNEW